MRLTKPLILASGSPRRRELLTLLQVPFEVLTAPCDENIAPCPPEQMVRELALRKALSAARVCQNGALVIGSDTVVALEGKIFGKPKDAEQAFEMLRQLQGRTHQVYTGVAIVEAQSETQNVSFCCTDVRVAPMSEEELRGYIATGEPMDKAGAYGIQGFFAPFVTGIDGCYYNVMGLPLHTLRTLLLPWAE
jgi:septum formation protein